MDAVDQVIFDTACNHSNGETCTYSCVHGYSPTVPDKTMTCDDGSWNVNSPCAEIGTLIWASSQENLSPKCPTKRVSNKSSQLQRLAQ